MKSFLLIFFAQFMVYFLVVVNTRAYTNDNYTLTAISDIVFASVNFFIIKKIAKDNSTKLDLLAYVLGGTIGSLLSMYISKHYFLV